MKSQILNLWETQTCNIHGRWKWKRWLSKASTFTGNCSSYINSQANHHKCEIWAAEQPCEVSKYVTLWRRTCGVDSMATVFQKDGSPTHFTHRVQHALNATFTNKRIERNEPTRPPISAGLTPLQCFTWGYMNTVYTQKTHDLHHPRDKLHCYNDNLQDVIVPGSELSNTWMSERLLAVLTIRFINDAKKL
jgi:hypothetical protein